MWQHYVLYRQHTIRAHREHFTAMTQDQFIAFVQRNIGV